METIVVLILAFLARLAFYLLEFLNWLSTLFEEPTLNVGPVLLPLCMFFAGAIFVAVAHRKLEARQSANVAHPQFKNGIRIFAILLLVYFTFEALTLFRSFGLLNDPRYQEMMHPLSTYQIAAVILFTLALGTIFLLCLRAIALPILSLALALHLGHLLITIIQYPYLAIHIARSAIFMIIKFGVPVGLAFYGWKQGVLTYGNSRQITAQRTPGCSSQ